MAAVRVTRGTRVYFNYGVESLAEGQEVPAGEFADYLLATGAPVEEVGEGLPGGSAKDVADWVGSDLGRAAEALATEQARDKPRSTLVTALEKILQSAPSTEPTA